MEHLIITVLGENEIGIADKLTEIAASSQCNIIDCRMNVFGNEFTANMHLSGSWSQVAKAETLLDNLARHDKIQCLRHRTEVTPYPKDVLPYIVLITAKDQPGLAHKVSAFFAEECIAISELYAEIRPARKSGVQIMSLTLYLNIPAEENIADLRERFIVFCDCYNLDGIMEAEKGM